MSLHTTLWQTIAALDRIAPDPDPEPRHSFAYSDANAEDENEDDYDFDEKTLYRAPAPAPSTRLRPRPHPYPTWRDIDDEKFLHLSTSATPPSYRPYLRRSRSQPSLRSSRLLPELIDFPARMEESPRRPSAAEEPKLTLRYVATVALDVTAVVVSFLLVPAAGIVLIVLAADSIAWGTGRGSQEANTAVIVVTGPWDGRREYVDRWVTKMSYLPQYYDTITSSGLIVAGATATLVSVVVGALSVVYGQTARRIELGERKTLSTRWFLLSRLVLEAFTFLVSAVVLICVRSLYYPESFNKYDSGYRWSEYTIQPQYLDPPLPPLSPNATYDSRVPSDDIFRYYRSPAHYNPMNWNASHTSNPLQHRLWQLCEEGNAARWLLVVLVLLQGGVLVRHAWAYWIERRAGEIPWTSQRLGSEERIASSSDEAE